jgi:ribulose 1,5-bisphosphate synthetase/thiazole synthase
MQLDELIVTRAIVEEYFKVFRDIPMWVRSAIRTKLVVDGTGHDAILYAALYSVMSPDPNSGGKVWWECGLM